MLIFIAFLVCSFYTQKSLKLISRETFYCVQGLEIKEEGAAVKCYSTE